MKILLPAVALAIAFPSATHAQHDHHAPPPVPATGSEHDPHQQAPADTPPPAPPADHSGHVMTESHSDPENGSQDMAAALGAYPMAREASGTAWQPDASVHNGVHLIAGDWTLMGHGMFNLVYDWQEGPRGDEKAFVSGMGMGTARRSFANGDALQFRVMLSPDPLMGKSGYPLHVASGETADGVTPLIDRQHPHDLFMELSASYRFRLSDKASLFLYGGLPGEPAFGPPPFMHRLSIMDSPEAPISHHWLDSTHITFGVVTAGLVYDRVKIEASRFNGREPDERRYNIETGPLDSTAARLSWNPTRELSLQGSWTHLVSPEQLEPGENSTRLSASAIYTRAIGTRGWWSTTAAWGRRSSEGESFDAWLLESAVGVNDWTLFGRAEATENNELVPVGGHHGPAFDVAKVSLGLIRDFPVTANVKLGIGGLYALNFVPAPLEALYAGDPKGAMAFVRLKID